MAYVPNSGSVVAFQSQPSSLLVGASVIGLTPVNVVSLPSPSVIAYQLAGSVLATSATTGNSSVVVNNILTGQSSVYFIPGVGVLGSVATLQGTSPWLITGSIAATAIGLQMTSIVNTVPSSVLVGASIFGTAPVTQVTSPWVISNTSVTTFQGGVWATSMVGGPININSILGTYQEKNAVTASVFGIPALFKIDETNSVLSAVSPQSPFPIRGSVAALQGTNPWIVVPTSGSIIATQIANSVMGVRTDNASVVAVLSTSSVAVLQGTNPWIVNMPSGSVIATQIANSVMGVRTDAASVVAVLSNSSVATLQGTNPWIIVPTSGSIFAYQAAGSVMAVNTTVTTGPSSVQLLSTSASIAVLVNNQVTGVSSVQLMSTSASIAVLVNNILTGNTSVQIISTSASIMVNNKAIFGANNTWTQNNSIISTGGTRNDTMSSVTAADTTYSPFAVGPVGEQLVANSPITKWVSGKGSVFGGTSIQVIAAPGTSIFTYITGINVINEGLTTARVTITQGLGVVAASILTYAIAPTGGGSNAMFLNPIRVLDNNGISASISAVASIYVTITGFNAKI